MPTKFCPPKICFCRLKSKNPHTVVSSFSSRTFLNHPKNVVGTPFNDLIRPPRPPNGPPGGGLGTVRPCGRRRQCGCGFGTFRERSVRTNRLNCSNRRPQTRSNTPALGCRTIHGAGIAHVRTCI